jgi:hypothetical protein
MEAVSQVLAGNLAPAEREAEMLAALQKFQSRREKLTRWGLMITMLSFVVGCFIVMAAGLQSYYPFLEVVIVELAGLAGLFLFGGSTLMVYASFLPKAPDPGEPSRRAALPKADTTSPLPPAQYSEPVPSVTEHTTHTLEPARREPPRARQ